MSGWFLEYAMIASFQILSSLSVTLQHDAI
jgi:hypothetical protein